MKSRRNARIPFFKGIMFKVLLGLVVHDCILLASIHVMMSTVATRLVLNESSKPIEQTGNCVVASVINILDRCGVLARTVANAAAEMPKDQRVIKAVISRTIDFNADSLVAGGGVWYEPNAFDGITTRKSFFWGRDEQNGLKFFDDYNASGLNYDESQFNTNVQYRDAFLKAPGYHAEEWYVVAEHMKQSSRGFWSRSYMDPYSHEPMVTVTVPFRSTGNLIGVSIIVLRLSGLHQLFQDWQKKDRWLHHGN